MRAIGLMSGTSLDGIDIAAIETDGEGVGKFGPTALHFYRGDEQKVLLRALDMARDLRDRTARPDALAEAEHMITGLHRSAVQAFLDANGIDRASIDVVGFHGQTVLHRPQDRLTVQLGDGPALAKGLGLPVVYDFRAADVAAGGQGAPLVPVYHRALVAALDRPGPVAVLNIGGVANVTWIDGDALIACDTGPGNAMIDDFIRARLGQACDQDGAQAARGRVDAAFIAEALAHPYFALPPPKSLDRNDFVRLAYGVRDTSTADGAATFTALTAATIAKVIEVLPRPPRSWVVAGGGAQNPTLMRMLCDRLMPAQIETADQVGWSGGALEAQAFAYLAVRSLRGLPLTFPGTTGIAAPLTGGVLARP